MMNKYLIVMVSGAKFWHTSRKAAVDLYDYNSIKVTSDQGDIIYLNVGNIEYIMLAGSED